MAATGSSTPIASTSRWDNPRAVHYYDRFCEEHDRYARANAELIAHSSLATGMQVLDFGAGLGHTARAALTPIGGRGRVVCFEPCGVMREEGARRLADSRISWVAALPEETGVFDRVLCGASIWQPQPLSHTLLRLSTILKPEGALCFNIPALYLGEPDLPGGGRDPLLLELPARLQESRPEAAVPPTGGARELLAPDDLEGLLVSLSLRPSRWTFEIPVTLATYRDWLKIPATTDRLLADLDPDARADLIDEASTTCDAGSWRIERWLGWTAWKQEHA